MGLSIVPESANGTVIFPTLLAQHSAHDASDAFRTQRACGVQCDRPLVIQRAIHAQAAGQVHDTRRGIEVNLFAGYALVRDIDVPFENRERGVASDACHFRQPACHAGKIHSRQMSVANREFACS